MDMMKNKNRNVSEQRNRRGWRRKRRVAGFTMAEMLIVVAIIGVLAGVSFVAVQNYQKSTTQLQYDAIAKEIFVAAQNHLTLAKSENYQDTATVSHSKGTPGNAEKDVQSTTEDGTEKIYNKDIYYFTDADYTSDGSSILDQMLPFGSVDLVTGGKFIIRYQPNAAKVLDVFYWTNDGKYGISGGVGYATAVDEYRDILDDAGAIATGNKNKRANYEGTGGILGWCGGEEIVSSGAYLSAPTVEVINAERLLVKVTDPNIHGSADIKALNPMLKLFVEGRTSKAVATIQLTAITDVNGTTAALSEPRPEVGSRLCDVDAPEGNAEVKYTVVLDDITAEGLHFSQLVKGADAGAIRDGYLTNVYLTIKYDMTKSYFIPGENIDIYAVAYSNKELTNVAYSGRWTTNSLFGEVTGTDAVAETVYVSNVRHFENLNPGISGVEYGTTGSYFGGSISAVQNTDLIWKDDKDDTNDFVSKIKAEKGEEQSETDTPVPIGAIYIYDDSFSASGGVAKATKADCFMPVTVTSGTLVYNGQSSYKEGDVTKAENHSISGVKVDNTTGSTDATGTNTMVLSSGGVFGSLTGATIRNLLLIDTGVTLATAGDAGALAGTLASCTVENVVAYNSTAAITTNVTASGNVGGLIGKVTGSTTAIEKSAAALVISSTGGNAGGLIGTMEGGALTGCYSGGHTYNGGYFDASKAAMYNVQAANGTAGGLIGAATGMGDVKNCYSTCSVKGAIAGGFVGTYAAASGSKLEDCYATGLVCGTGKEESEITVGTGSDGKYYKDLPKDGAFAYSLTGLADADVSNCQYYEIINERIEREINVSGRKLYTIYATKPDTSGSKDSYVFLTALGKLGTGSTLVITPLDATAATYNAFVGPPADNTEDPDNPVLGWTKAVPCDSKLLEYYSVKNEDDVLESKFNLRNVVRLGATLKKDGTDTTEYYVATHYGDWPAPEIFVINAAS